LPLREEVGFLVSGRCCASPFQFFGPESVYPNHGKELLGPAAKKM